MKTSNPRFGIVLAGGGARGAYHAGALRYLAEVGVQPDIIAGTSIGALNGAVLASHALFPQAVDRLNDLWNQLGQEDLLRPNLNAAFRVANYATQAFTPNFKAWLFDFLLQQNLLKHSSAFFDPEPIERLVREAIHAKDLKQGIELWVTVFPSLKIPGLRYDYLLDLVRSFAGSQAQWLCVQDCQDEETLYNLLLASAAIPFAFPSREVNGKFYVDGGLGDNVPLGALAARGCTYAIVIHLSNGSTWNRHQFSNQTVIEIRPEQPMDQSGLPILGGLDSLLNFDSTRIAQLKQWGYEDAKRCLAPIFQTLSAIAHQREQLRSLTFSTNRLLSDPPLP